VIRFLSLSEVLLIYEDQVRRYGGIYGVRGIHLLSSTVYVPQAMYEGEYLHKTVPSMAAAHAYYISQNHALLDGNIRLSKATALVLL
jgi:death-on-curing protein